MFRDVSKQVGFQKTVEVGRARSRSHDHPVTCTAIIVPEVPMTEYYELFSLLHKPRRPEINTTIPTMANMYCVTSTGFQSIPSRLTSTVCLYI